MTFREEFSDEWVFTGIISTKQRHVIYTKREEGNDESLTVLRNIRSYPKWTYKPTTEGSFHEVEGIIKTIVDGLKKAASVITKHFEKQRKKAQKEKGKVELKRGNLTGPSTDDSAEQIEYQAASPSGLSTDGDGIFDVTTLDAPIHPPKAILMVVVAD
ncbi:hypothetical protein HK097_003776, partial [Rhizophlyctis rosea]